MVTLRNSQWIEAGQEAELSYTLAGSSSANNQVQLEVSRIPSVDISRRFDFLYNYQHHCTEQLTSKALPLLFVSQFTAVDEQEAEKIKTNVQEAIRQDVYKRQDIHTLLLQSPLSHPPNSLLVHASLFELMLVLM